LLLHLGKHGLGAQERTFDVDGGDSIPLLTGYFVERMALDIEKDRRVVDEDIDSPEHLYGLGRHACSIFLPRNIDLQSDGFAARCGDLFDDILTVEDISDDNCRPFCGKPATIGCADVPRSSGDDGDFTTPAS